MIQCGCVRASLDEMAFGINVNVDKADSDGHSWSHEKVKRVNGSIIKKREKKDKNGAKSALGSIYDCRATY